MRNFSPICLNIACAGTMLLNTLPLMAQQAPVPPVPVVSPSSAVPVATSDPGISPVLYIPAPPVGKLRVEMDARSEDLLGVMKSFLKGMGETGVPVAPKTAGQAASASNPLADMLVNGNLADMMKDINQVHFVVYELPVPPTPAFEPNPTPKYPKKAIPPPPSIPPAPAFDSNAFYESAFSAEGAHRIMFADADDYKLLMVGFPDRKGYAFAVSGAGYVAVSRSDGYPNMEVLSAFFSRASSAVMISKVVKDAMDKTMESEKPDIAGGKDSDTDSKSNLHR